MWNWIIGPGGLLLLVLALATSAVSAVVREYTVDPDGTDRRAATSHPLINGTTALLVLLAFFALVLRLGALS